MKSAGETDFFSTNRTLRVGNRLLDLSIPRIMGVLNVTPDSFFSGSRQNSESAIITSAEKMLKDGADILDVGGYSTRPGAADISEAEETDRITFALDIITRQFPEAIISIDTFRSQVARRAVDSGAHIINDVSGGTLDDAMFTTVASLRVPYILMHMRGNPQTMTKFTDYENLTEEVAAHLQEKIQQLHQAGVSDIIVDPGFGFAKTIDQNFELLHHLSHLKMLKKPVLVGLSRKSMIWKTLSITANDALNGTTALNTIALIKGASILRVHDVMEAAQTVKLVHALNASKVVPLEQSKK